MTILNQIKFWGHQQDIYNVNSYDIYMKQSEK